jgi:hypothetical protein
MNSDLNNLLQKKQQAASSSGSINWDDRRDKYLADIASLYAQVERILAKPIKQKVVTIQRREKKLTENYIGTYSVEDLILLIGNEQVRFSPRGRNVVGANGRIDVLGERGEVSLIVQPGSRWGFVQSRQPTLRIVPFDEASFADVLKIVMRD